MVAKSLFYVGNAEFVILKPPILKSTLLKRLVLVAIKLAVANISFWIELRKALVDFALMMKLTAIFLG